MPIAVLTLLAVVGLLAGASVSGSRNTSPLVGLATNVSEGGGRDELVRNILLAKSLGVRHWHLPWKWRDLEPRPGEYALEQVDEAVKGLTRLGFQASAMIQTIDTNNRTLPADLADEAFDSARLLKRWEELLRQMVPRLPADVRWLALGNEVDIYLKAHPREVAPFIRFLEHGRKVVREIAPRLKVSITVTHDGVRDNPEMAARLMKGMDFASFTYYPLNRDMTVRPIAEVPLDMERMVKAAGKLPILFQELGFPAGRLNNSDEEKQAAFVDACFDFIKACQAPIEAFSFFMLHDFDKKMLDELVGYYGIADPRFRSFLGTLGLKSADGTPRKAWTRFEQRTRAWPRD